MFFLEHNLLSHDTKYRFMTKPTREITVVNGVKSIRTVIGKRSYDLGYKKGEQEVGKSLLRHSPFCFKSIC